MIEFISLVAFYAHSRGLEVSQLVNPQEAQPVTQQEVEQEYTAPYIPTIEDPFELHNMVAVWCREGKPCVSFDRLPRLFGVDDSDKIIDTPMSYPMSYPQ